MYYIKDNENKILIAETSFEQIQNAIIFRPELQGAEILETKEGETIYDFELMTIEEAEAKKQEKELAHINTLTCTKRNFALMLQQYGITYSQLKELISTNEQAQLEWDLCERLERSNPLLDVMAAQLNITPDILDKMFQYANGEIDTLE